MSADEKYRRRKSTRHRKSEKVSQADRRKHESAISPEPEPSERPTTVEDLRSARLAYLATPPEERRRKMKYEYVKTVKVKERRDDVPAKEGSTVSKTKSISKGKSRSHRSESKRKTESTQDDEEAQYVYRTSRPQAHVPGAFDAVEREPAGRTEKSKSRSKSTRTTRSKTERRNTEPITRQETVRSEVAESSRRPQLRKSTTTVADRPRQIPRTSSVPVIPQAESATVVSTSTTAKKSPSIFSSLFPPRSQPIERKVPCLTCGDDVLAVRTAKLPCTHRMCHTCLKRLFKLSVTDPAHMPPRCCEDQAISLKHVDSLFDREFKENYNKKLKEYKTKNRIYCPARDCGEWIQPKYMGVDKGRKVGRCPRCKTQVCGICSQKMHKTRDCPKDPATKEFVETAKKAGWKKCYSCNAMVELKEGCNHMTCRCTAEFCMVCGLKWKSCDCPWFNYEQADLLGDPVRFQQEMDRRRDQEQRDEAIARRIEALQVDDDRPAMFEWLNAGNAAGARANRNQNQPLRNQGQPAQPARGRWDLWGAPAQFARPAMPGAWDDGPHQFEQLPQVPARYQHGAEDPAVLDPPEPTTPPRDGARVARNRSNRWRANRQNPVVFEGRQMTEAEREEERRIRAWATNGHDE